MTTTKRKPAAKTTPAKKPTPAKPYYPKPKLNKGEVYVGAIMLNDRPHHLVLLPGEAADVDHAQATAWAAEQGGTLPTLAAALMLFERAKTEFKPDIYWTSAPYERDPGFAWGQVFLSGFQDGWNSDDELRARAVRTISI